MKSLSLCARLINCARGGIYNEEALVQGLKSGKLAGVALDVYAEEPCTDSPLFGMPGVLCTPHLGASTEEAQTQVAVEAVELLLNYLVTGEIRHAVNMAAVDPKTLEAIRGYLDVAHRMGKFLAQSHTGKILSLRIRYRGEVAAKDTKLITSSLCAGLVETAMDEDVNIVNAGVLLKQRGIEVKTESTQESGAFSSSMVVELETDKETFVAGGTLLGNNMPRLILLQDYRLEAYLDGVLLVFTHDDVPGIIGKVGSVFGNHNVNIAQMSVGRAEAGKEAIGVLNLDSRPPQAALDEILGSGHIHRAFVVELPAIGEKPAWM